jgi:transketolase
MGDLVGDAVSGKLYYVPAKEFLRLKNKSLNAIENARIFSDMCRINTLFMIAKAGSGHIGSSFSSMDIISWLHLNELRGNINGPISESGDIFFSSKGHDAPALYSVLIGLGKLDFDLIHQLRRLGGLPGHPDISTPNIITNTGSLGMGVSKAKGMIFANRNFKKSVDVFVLTGDGELQEGQFWESLVSAANHKLNELTVIIDHNKLQSDTFVSKVSDLGDLETKLLAFGWHVRRCDGNDIKALSETLKDLKSLKDKPKVIIADTIKGKGVSFMEHTSLDSDVDFYKFHSGAPTSDAYGMAVNELIARVNTKFMQNHLSSIEMEMIERPVVNVVENLQRLIPAYSKALSEQARNNPKLIALDADLILDTGLIPFKNEFPERFVECGIAEQDMVSQAGGMALRGLLPVVHSFACFLSARPNEQIYNNATEATKIIYVGSLAGVVPGGPGHSHQAVRDISALSAIPGLVIMEPSCEKEVSLLLQWCVVTNKYSSYLRLVSIPWSVNFRLPEDYIPSLGLGIELRSGSDLAIISYGPIMISSAIEVSDLIYKNYDISIKVINMPWLNIIEPINLAKQLESIENVISIDNHYRIGGQGDRVAELFATVIPNKILHRISLDEVPASGTIQECLYKHQFDINSLFVKFELLLKNLNRI